MVSHGDIECHIDNKRSNDQDSGVGNSSNNYNVNVLLNNKDLTNDKKKYNTNHYLANDNCRIIINICLCDLPSFQL